MSWWAYLIIAVVVLRLAWCAYPMCTWLVVKLFHGKW